MRGYPKHINTKQDFLNLLSDNTLREQALKDLERIYNLNDDTVTRVVSGSEETEDLITEEIPNPMPVWKRLGFTSKDELADLIAKYS